MGGQVLNPSPFCRTLLPAVDVAAYIAALGPLPNVEFGGANPVNFRANKYTSGSLANRVNHVLNVRTAATGTNADWQAWNEYDVAYPNPGALTVDDWDLVHSRGRNLNESGTRINPDEPMMAEVWEYCWRPSPLPRTTAILEKHRDYYVLGPQVAGVDKLLKWDSEFMTHDRTSRANSILGLRSIRANQLEITRYDTNHDPILNDPSCGITATQMNLRNRLLFDTSDGVVNVVTSDRSIQVNTSTGYFSIPSIGAYFTNAYHQLDRRTDLNAGVSIPGTSTAYGVAGMIFAGGRSASGRHVQLRNVDSSDGIDIRGDASIKLCEIAPASAQNKTLAIDPADGKLYHKDAAGVVNKLT